MVVEAIVGPRGESGTEHVVVGVATRAGAVRDLAQGRGPGREAVAAARCLGLPVFVEDPVLVLFAGGPVVAEGVGEDLAVEHRRVAERVVDLGVELLERVGRVGPGEAVQGAQHLGHVAGRRGDEDLVQVGSGAPLVGIAGRVGVRLADQLHGQRVSRLSEPGVPIKLF